MYHYGLCLYSKHIKLCCIMYITLLTKCTVKSHSEIHNSTIIQCVLISTKAECNELYIFLRDGEVSVFIGYILLLKLRK